MSFGLSQVRKSHFALITFGLTVVMGCTKSVPTQFKLLPAEQSTDAAFEVTELKVENLSVPVDILWVVDNSASMSTSQVKLKNGLAKFANDYLTKSGTDIQLAVITTDAFVANAAWEKYLSEPNPETKKTPLQVHKEKEPNQRQWGPDYAKLTSSALMSSKKSGLVSSFQSRVLVGTQGMYEEHGFDSVSQFIADNEKGTSPNKLFRKGSQRIIIFLSDENDQSIGDNVGPEPRKLLYSGSYYTGIDQAKADKILPAQFTINCPGEANVIGKPITAATAMTLCGRPENLEPVDQFKGKLDAFFRELDGNPNGNPNYFVTAIVGVDGATIEGLRRNTTEKSSETKLPVITNELGTRYVDLVNQAGNGSFAMDIGASDYSPILKKVGLEIQKRSVQMKTTPNTSFDFERAPDTKERLVVTVEFASTGKRLALVPSQYQITGKKLVIIDKALIATLQAGDRVSVQYQPNEQVPASSRK